jgi:hypothetical protein
METKPLLRDEQRPRSKKPLVLVAVLIIASVTLSTQWNEAPSPTVLEAEQVPAFLQTVYPGVHLAVDSIFTSLDVLNNTMGIPSKYFYLPSQMALGGFVRALLPQLAASVGQPKVDVLDKLNGVWHNSLKGNKPLPDHYLPFGPASLTHFDDHTTEDLSNTLALFFKTNAFYASALSLCGGHPCIRSRDGDGWYAKIMASADHTAYHLVDAVFDDHFRIVHYDVYRTVNGKETHVDATPVEAYQHLSAMLNYYSECLHTAIHTFQYVGGAALLDASAESPKMRQFVGTFAMNVFKTYSDVVGLDLHPANPAANVPAGVLVGGLFAADRDGILNTLSEVIASWGSFRSAQEWVDRFALRGFTPEAVHRLGLLTAFRAQTTLLHPYAMEVVAHIRRDNDYHLPAVEDKLKKFFAGAGLQKDGHATFAVADLRTWLELQAVTSIFHGQTFSFTRFMATRSAFTAISPSDNFTEFDLGYYRATSPTIIGAQPDRFVMGDVPLKQDGVTDEGLLAVIGRHTQKTAALKEFELKRFAAENDLATHGWIVADFFPEGWDGRQLTINSYI